MVIDVIQQYRRFYLYGAQVVAFGAYRAIRHLCGRTPECFLVGSLAGNPESIEGIPVNTAAGADLEALIVVAVTELLQEDSVAGLRQQGFANLFLLTQHEEHLLMSAYFAAIGKFPLARPVGEGTRSLDFALYEVRNHRDKELSARPPLQGYEHTIQAGAAITEARVASILDNGGENISAKNKQYCEMTATYWVWKNTSHDWKGIEHYRRHLLIEPEMLGEEVDAILPLPYLCYPNTLSQFRRFVSESVKAALFRALLVLHPQEYELYINILEGEYQYTYNLVCARSQVFDAYCAWFFRITKYMENMYDEVPELAETRAFSYVAEVLTNLYFMSHQDSLRIRHVEKGIYV